ARTFPHQDLPLIICRDTREAGPILRRGILCGIKAAAGARGVRMRFIDLGVLPKPIAPVALGLRRALGGCIITASHNDPPFDGLELLTAFEEPYGGTSRGALLGMETVRDVMTEFERLREDPAAYFELKEKLGKT